MGIVQDMIRETCARQVVTERKAIGGQSRVDIEAVNWDFGNRVCIGRNDYVRQC